MDQRALKRAGPTPKPTGTLRNIKTSAPIEHPRFRSALTQAEEAVRRNSPRASACRERAQIKLCGRKHMNADVTHPARRWGSNPMRRTGIALIASLGFTSASQYTFAVNPVHPNPTADQDEATVLHRADVVKLPQPLKHTLGELARELHNAPPTPAFAEADKSSQLFQYYLLDTRHFQPNVFTAIVPGLNDGAIPTAANAANGRRPTFGAVRVVLEPKPGLPTEPDDIES